MAPPDTKNAGPADDLVLAFRTVKSRTQGRIVRLGAAANDILGAHGYPEPVTELLGEALALTAMLGSLVRANGKLILQTKSDGPVGMLAVHYRAPGRLRGLATFDATRLGPPRERRDGRPGRVGQGHLLGTGHLALTIDPGTPGGNEPRTQGIVAIANHSLAQAAHTYFRQSEQIPTFVRLAVARQSVRGGGWHWRAGGLILQQLPQDVGTGEETAEGGLVGDAQEDWQRARMLAQTVEDHELLDPTLPPDRLLYRLFAEEGVRTVTPVPVEANCGCTRERVEALLKGFGKDELADMREPDGSVGVTCEYCTTRYTFSPDEVSAL